MTWQEVADEINRCEYLYLRSISEETELRLKLIVEEARPQPGYVGPPAGSPELEELYRHASRIGSDEGCRLFQIVYDYPVSYTVLNETYGKYPEPPEAFTGKLFRIFSWSYLLEMTLKTTYVCEDHPGPLPPQHHSIACLNHVIDVITTKEPEMTLLRGGWPRIVSSVAQFTCVLDIVEPTSENPDMGHPRVRGRSACC